MEWKMKAARFCKDLCPVCKRARKKQEGICYWLVRNVDRKVCPCCKSYESVYGRLAYEPELPDED